MRAGRPATHLTTKKTHVSSPWRNTFVSPTIATAARHSWRFGPLVALWRKKHFVFLPIHFYNIMNQSLLNEFAEECRRAVQRLVDEYGFSRERAKRLVLAELASERAPPSPSEVRVKINKFLLLACN
jgi:hypothetical protein